MILYFSGTGNSSYIATLLSKELSSEIINLLPYIKENKELIVDSPTTIVFCTPIYICSIPSFLIKYLKTIKFTQAKNCYFVFTSGGYDGIAKYYAKKIAKACKLNYLGSIHIKMPRNYIANNHYPELSNEEILSRIKKARNSIKDIANIINNLQKPKHRHVFLFEYIITIPFIPIYSKFKLTTKDFYTNEKCVGCSKCANNCPLNVIKMIDNRPTWEIDHCAHCMSCINNCPYEAIEYSNFTKGKRRYSLDKYIEH